MNEDFNATSNFNYSKSESGDQSTTVVAGGFEGGPSVTTSLVSVVVR